MRQALGGHRGWGPAWRDAAPKSDYDIIVVGGGGHGLATAHYLAKVHGISKVAVLEKGWIGSGNAGRNTTIIRSNYLLPGNNPFYEWSMKLWEGLEQDLNYNAMVSQRGVLNLYHSDAQRDAYVRRGNGMRMHGVDAEMLDAAGVRRMLPFLDFENARFPIQGGLLQRRGGTARHDAVVWGYARAASDRGVDIIQNCEVTGFIRDGERDCGRANHARPDPRGQNRARGRRQHIAARRHGGPQAPDRKPRASGVRLRSASSPSSRVWSPSVPVISISSQSDKGGLVFGGDLDGYNSYAQRGNLPTVEDVCEGGMALIPAIGRVRLLRSWGGVMDMSMDGSPIIDRTPLARPVPQCRVVLRRLQGDAGLGLVFRAPARAR